MKIRHRIPTIFNLSMVDVLCCALGCVILLWLINMREFKMRSLAAAETGKQLAATQASLEETNRQASESHRRLTAADQLARELAAGLQSARGERDAARERAAELAKDQDELRKKLARAAALGAELDKELSAQKDRGDAAESKLSRAAIEARELTRERMELARRLADSEKLLREKELLASAASKSSESLAAQLRDAEARAKQMRTALDVVASSKDKLGNAEARIAALEEEKKALADKALRAQAAVENRFAGMALTGRRVVFLIDMSGSMELIDERTPATEKWTGVRETLAKIMRSLQDLERFQVILFSDKVLFPLGGEDNWIDFDVKTSPDKVMAALGGVKPKGNTNMHAGLQAAFRYRALGLDTVYLFSDGLPNIGEGLTAEAAQKLRETERAEVLTRYVRNVMKTEWNKELPGKPKVRLNTLGFFYESPDVGAFLWALSRENDGGFVGMSKP